MFFWKDLSKTQETLKCYFSLHLTGADVFYNYLIFFLMSQVLFGCFFPRFLQKYIFLIFWQNITRRSETFRNVFVAEIYTDGNVPVCPKITHWLLFSSVFFLIFHSFSLTLQLNHAYYRKRSDCLFIFGDRVESYIYESICP